jgi:ribulose-5-phosphate 4-epimerase/fuculose-1-phosphate aldolase
MTLAARVDLAAAHRWALRDGLCEGTWNHLSLALDDRGERILLTPPSTHWSQVRAGNLLELDGGDAERLERDGGLGWVAYRIHAPLHEARPDAACVLHLHSPHATALSMLKDSRLLPAEQNALDFQGRIAYADEYDGGGPADLDHGAGIAAALGGKAVLLLKNHGVIVTGATVADAYADLYMFERACRVMILALSTGRELQLVEAEVADAAAAATLSYDFKRDHFEALKRVLDAEDPDYRE